MTYRTAQKQALLNFLQQYAHRAFTVDEIAHSLQGENAPGKSTVYRLLGQLVESGEVRKFLKPDSRVAMYQAMGCKNCERHLHLKCTDCGKLLHLGDGASAALLQNVLQQSEFAVDERETVLYGKCAGCREKGC